VGARREDLAPRRRREPDVLALLDGVDDFQVVTTRPGDIVIRCRTQPRRALAAPRQTLTWLPTQWLTLVGTLGFNDAKFLEFRSAAVLRTCRTPTATPIRAAI